MTDLSAERNIVLNMLLLSESGGKCHIILKDTLDENSKLEKNQKSFVSRLFKGTLERRIELDYILGLYSKIPVSKMKPVIRNILRAGVYQIIYMDSVPDSAACNEAVKLARQRKFSGLSGFVNAVLRNIARNKDNIKYPEDEKERIAVKYSMPEWIVAMWKRDYPEHCMEILDSIYEDRDTPIRCNTSKAEINEIVSSLRKSGVNVRESGILPEIIYVSGYEQLDKLDMFKSGAITVQNPSSVMAGIAADPQKGDIVLDICAAPGGKSLHVAEMLKGSGMVVARDVSSRKVGLIEDNNRRMRYSNLRCETADALIYDSDLEKKFDIVIADLPCTGLGDIAAKPDIKYSVSEEKINEMAQMQRDILSNAMKYVKPGGKLVYSTCTVDLPENDENASWIENNSEFEQVDLSGLIPVGEVRKGCVQIFPGKDLDGFFISLFRRKLCD